MSSPCYIRFRELVNKDRILCTTREHTRDVVASVQIMEFVDEIHGIDYDIRCLVHQEHLHEIDLDRSSKLISILREYREERAGKLRMMKKMRGLE